MCAFNLIENYIKLLTLLNDFIESTIRTNLLKKNIYLYVND